ncbi:MAG: ROK family protein [Erysipelotrichaceae bacterium]
MKKYIGIDLGGTNVRVACIDEQGSILESIIRPSLAQEGPDAVIKNLKDMISEITLLKECSGIGIGVPGPVDTVKKVMTMSSNLPGFTDYPICDILEKQFNMPVYIDNDANVAGLAEAIVGSGKGSNIVYFTTVSTGIGGALVVDGKVVSGYKGYAGEVGNLIIDRTQTSYNHLNDGAFETLCSGSALIRALREVYKDDSIDSAKVLFDRYLDKDPIAVDLYEKFINNLAIGFSLVAHICDPEVFVLGGGMMKSKDVWFNDFYQKYLGYVHSGMREVRFEFVSLPEPGIVGAAMLVKSNK